MSATGHLDRDTLLEILEGRRTGASAPHLAHCERCRAELEQLQQVWQIAGGVDVPEPSPLFWDHLSARVREAVAAEAAMHASWTGRWTSGWRLAGIGVAGMALAAALAMPMRTGRSTPSVSTAPAAQADIVASDPSGDGDNRADDDGALALLVELTGDFDWDAAAEAGIAVRAGEVDMALAALTEDERIELRRMLDEALRGSGV